jgi:hypothetical protein
MAQHSPLCRIPTELLENIALELALTRSKDSRPLGLPLNLASLLGTCKQINHALRLENNHNLYARIFRGMFDVGAARRRYGPRAVLSSSLAHQLVLHCSALRNIHQGDIYSNGIKYILWAAFLMLSENDGMNMAQLEWAGLDNFIYRFVRMRLFEGRGRHRGWPVESEENALALWIMVMTYDERMSSLLLNFVA